MDLTNEAAWDRVLRVLLGVLLLLLGWTKAVPEPWATVFLVFSWVPLVTGLVGWCPFYAIFRVRTNKPYRRQGGPAPGADERLANSRDPQ